jgi:hypothetical protein
MKLLKPKSTESNNLLKHPNNIGKTLDMYKRVCTHEPFDRRELYKTQNLYDE